MSKEFPLNHRLPNLIDTKCTALQPSGLPITSPDTLIEGLTVKQIERKPQVLQWFKHLKEIVMLRDKQCTSAKLFQYDISHQNTVPVFFYWHLFGRRSWHSILACVILKERFQSSLPASSTTRKQHSFISLTSPDWEVPLATITEKAVI